MEYVFVFCIIRHVIVLGSLTLSRYFLWGAMFLIVTCYGELAAWRQIGRNVVAADR